MMQIFSFGLLTANRPRLGSKLFREFHKSNRNLGSQASYSRAVGHDGASHINVNVKSNSNVTALDGVELFLYNDHLYVMPEGAANIAHDWLEQGSKSSQIDDLAQRRLHHLINDLSLRPILAGFCLAESRRFLQKSDDSYLFNWLINLGLRGIYIDPTLSESQLAQWAKLSATVQQPLRLLLPIADELPHYHYPLQWQLKCWGDWWAALLIVIVLSPLLLITAGLVKLTSKGPVLFAQWRVGKQGKLFKILKFRTMIVEAEALHHQVMAGQNGLHKCQKDPRITVIGGFLRKYSIDELPQLFNVLRGEMSLVGPRPWALYDALRIEGAGKRRLNALPGLTGAWQVSKRSTLLDLNAVTQYDLQYLVNWSLFKDLQILFLTVPKVLSGFGAF